MWPVWVGVPPRVCMETTGGDEKTNGSFCWGPWGLFSFFGGVKNSHLSSLYRDDFRCLIINKNPVVLLSNPEVEVVLECSSQVIKEENHSNWLGAKSACSRSAWDFVPKDESL